MVRIVGLVVKKNVFNRRFYTLVLFGNSGSDTSRSEYVYGKWHIISVSGGNSSRSCFVTMFILVRRIVSTDSRIKERSLAFGAVLLRTCASDRSSGRNFVEAKRGSCIDEAGACCWNNQLGEKEDDENRTQD